MSVIKARAIALLYSVDVGEARKINSSERQKCPKSYVWLKCDR